ncbi:MAG: TIGR03905 family TSCPD domain-containing protein [Epulopiscium sp.]|nr:TIGR03905 family TSCPD domain-containing protein [Candidatus Epulonipiscium sp.]
MHTYITQGVCAKKITFNIENNRIKNVNFEAGCSGNLQGISQLVEGMPVEEVMTRLKGIKCNNKPTSCPDQLALAMEQILNNSAK